MSLIKWYNNLFAPPKIVIEEKINNIIMEQPQPPTFKRGEPQYLSEYIGQENAKDMLKLALKSTCINYSLPHILITGNAGHGKTGLAKIMANETNANFYSTTGDSLHDDEDVIDIFMKAFNSYKSVIKTSPIIFIDEIHALGKKAQRLFYVPLAEGLLDYRGSRIECPPFSVIGATTDGGYLSVPMMTRFQIRISLRDYTQEEIALIIFRLALEYNLPIVDSIINYIAKRSKFNPRIAIHHFHMASYMDFNIDKYFGMQGIDDMGLDKNDRLILSALSRADRPCSLKTISTITGVNQTEIAAFYEPYLVRIGFINLTMRGREITEAGRNYA